MSTNENKISPDDPRLTAFALGELEGEELAQLEAELRADPAAQAIVAQIRIAADQFQAALAGETVEAAASGEGPAQAARRGSHSIFRRFLIWGIPLAACLALLLVHENLRRQAHEPDSVVALSRPIAETAAKVPAPAAMFDRAKAVGALAGSPSPAGAVQPGFGKKATDQGRVEPPAVPAESEAVTLSPFEVNAAQAKGTFTPSTTTGTRLANNIGDIPSSVTVVDKQQLENTNEQSIDDITPAMPAVAKPSVALVPRRFNQVSGLIGGVGGRGAQGVSGTVSTSTGTDGKAAVKDLGNIAVPVPDNSAWILNQIDRGVPFDQLTTAPNVFPTDLTAP